MSSSKQAAPTSSSAIVTIHEYRALPVFNNLGFVFVAIPFSISVFLTSLYLHYAPANVDTLTKELLDSKYLPTIANIITVIQLVWCGMLVAVSIDAVVKFRATQLPKWIGFDVGRTIFATVNRYVSPRV